MFTINNEIHQWILFYAAGVNLLALAAYGWDKYCAIHHRWRVSEIMLLVLAAIGGSVGAIMGMRLFHHKTLHWKFRIGVPLCLMLHCLLLIWLNIHHII